MPERTARQIYNRILEAEHILLVPHQDPDGDALGSVAALMHFLKNEQIDHTVFCETSASQKMNFLPYIEELTTDKEVWKKSPFDLIVVVDSSDLDYAGVENYLDELDQKPDIINIDHHSTNTYFGDLNLVIDSASSTTHILYDFFKTNHIKIDSHLATCLLTGLITDTDNFTNAATTVASLEIAGDLVKKGGDIKMIKQIMFEDKSINTLKLWGTALSRLSKHDDHEIVYTYLTQEDLKNFNVEEEESKGIANFMNVLEDGKAALILKEKEENKTKASLRTTRDDIDVSKIAKKMGGGGHKKAAGFSSNKSVKDTLKQVWKTLEENKN
jgi:phosphoesterase RecJ-like protein